MNYPSTEYLKQLKKLLPVYFAHLDKVKPKRMKQIELVYKDIYDLQYDVLPIINDIENSHLLGRNIIIIPFFNYEWNRLGYMIRRLQSGYTNEKSEKVHGLKDLKQFGEVLGNMKPLTNLLNKDFDVMRQKDLAHLERTWGLNNAQL
jgi:hypothetical protein